MKFSEAKDRLKELAGGRYHSIHFEMSEYTTGEQETECWLYIDDRCSVKGQTWEQAFCKMEERLMKQIEEMPDVEA